MLAAHKKEVYEGLGWEVLTFCAPKRLERDCKTLWQLPPRTQEPPVEHPHLLDIFETLVTVTLSKRFLQSEVTP